MTSLFFMDEKKTNPKLSGKKITTRAPRTLRDQFNSWLATNAEHFRRLGLELNMEDAIGSMLLDFMRKEKPQDQLDMLELRLPQIKRMFAEQQATDDAASISTTEIGLGLHQPRRRKSANDAASDNPLAENVPGPRRRR